MLLYVLRVHISGNAVLEGGTRSTPTRGNYEARAPRRRRPRHQLLRAGVREGEEETMDPRSYTPRSYAAAAIARLAGDWCIVT